MRARTAFVRISALVGIVMIFLSSVLQAQLHKISLKGKLGLVSDAGEVILAPEFDDITYKGKNLWVLKKDGLTGWFGGDLGMLVNPEFKVVTEVSKYTSLFLGRGKDVMVCVDDSLTARTLEADSIRYRGQNYLTYTAAGVGATDFRANQIVPSVYDEISSSSQFLFARRGKQWDIFDANGKKKTTLQAEWIRPAFYYVFYFKENEKWGLADTLGRKIIPAVYDSVVVQDRNLVVVRRAGLLGLYNPNGRLILEAQYNTIELSGNLFFLACENDGCSLFDLQGKKVCGAGKWQAYNPLSSRYIEVQNENGFFGVIDSTGKLVVRDESSEPFRLNGENLMVKANKGGWLLLDAKGKPRTEVAMDEVAAFQFGLAVFRSQGKSGLISQQGKVVVKAIYDDIERMSTTARIRKGTTWETKYFTEDGKPSDAPQILLDRDRWVNDKRNVGSGGAGGAGRWARSSKGWYLNDNNLWGLGDSVTGMVIIPPQFSRVNQVQHGRFCEVVSGEGLAIHYGLVDMKKRRIVVPTEYNLIRTWEFDHGRVAGAQTSKGNWVLIDEFGKVKPGKGITHIRAFSHGVAAVCEGGKMTGKDVRGLETVCEKQDYKTIKSTNGISYYEITGGKWGILDSLGHWVVKPAYDFISSFEKGVAVYRKGRNYGLLSATGMELTAPVYSDVSFFRHLDSTFVSMQLAGNRYGIVTESGEWKIKPMYDEMKNLSEGIVPVRAGNEWYYIDSANVRVGEKTFSDAFAFSEGWGRVKTAGGYNWVNREGECLNKFGCVRAGDFHEGRAWFQENGLMHYMCADGSKIGNFRTAGDFRSGVAIVQDEKGTGLCNTSGSLVSKLRGRSMTWLSDSAVAASNGSKMGVVSLKGEWILHPRYTAILAKTEGFFIVKRESTVFIVDCEGHKLFKQVYSDIKPFSEGLAAVRSEEGWGYINLQGIEMIAPQYSQADKFVNGFASVKSGRAYLFIRHDGSVLKMDGNEQAGCFQEGYAPVKRSLKRNEPALWFFTDTAGVQIKGNGFLDVTPFQNGKAWVKTNPGWRLIGTNGNYMSDITLELKPVFTDELSPGRSVPFSSLHDAQGREILPPHFESYSSDGNLIKVISGGSWGYIKSDGTWVWELK